MNKKIVRLLTLFLLLFSQSGIYALISLNHTPSETIILKLHTNYSSSWKDLSRMVNKTTGIVELIPINQSSNNWSNLICIQYESLATLNQEMAQDVTVFINNVHKSILSSYPSNKITWKITEST